MTFEELRTKQRWTRTLLAKKLGINRQTIAYWERSTIYPTIDKIIKLAEVLETTPAEILNSLIEQKRRLDTTLL